MYAVVHGGTNRELRQLSIDYLTSLPFDGFAMGGSFGKLGDELVDMIGFMAPQLPKDRPNHLLGIADLPSIRKCVPLGVDTFDSAFPSRVARHGCLLAEPHDIKIANSKWARFHEPISPYLPYTAAYLHHLFKAKVRSVQG
jgi:queuine tRNA-ribosyltransferase